MSDPSLAPERIEQRSDLGDGDAALFAFWQGQERIAEKDEKNWSKRSRAIIKRYRDERPEAMNNTHRFNVLWSNVQTLKPIFYARTPKPDVQRRFLDQDDTGRFASTLLERGISYSLEQHGFDQVMEAVVEDRLLPGRGTARVLYVPHFGETLDAEGDNAEFEADEAAASDVDNPGDEDEPLRAVDYEEAVCSYVFWEDYRESPARSWREVTWVRYRAYMTRDQLIARFRKKKAAQVNLDYAPRGSADNEKEKPPPDLFKKAVVHEVWDKEKKRVVWYAPGTPDLILDQMDDPLRLPDFFPSPDPLLATTTTDRRIPVPDYVEYQDQARELDTLTSRIDRLTRALKVSGVYPGSEKQVLQQLIDEGTENRLIPVEDWMHFADKGGLKDMIQWVPIQQIAQTLIQLYDARDRVKQIIYETTGIGDIMRGNTSPLESATAQTLKAGFSTRRVLPQQRAVARFARDLIRLIAAVIAEHFSAETISQITGFPVLAPVPQLPPAPMQWVPAPMQLTGPGAPMAGPPPLSLQGRVA
jgi:hypothetical protein